MLDLQHRCCKYHIPFREPGPGVRGVDGNFGIVSRASRPEAAHPRQTRHGSWIALAANTTIAKSRVVDPRASECESEAGQEAYVAGVSAGLLGQILGAAEQGLIADSEVRRELTADLVAQPEVEGDVGEP